MQQTVSLQKIAYWVVARFIVKSVIVFRSINENFHNILFLLYARCMVARKGDACVEKVN